MKTFFSTFILEAKNIFTSVSAMIIIFGGSLFYLFLYPTPYYEDIVNAQKIAIVDYDKTNSSREFISFIRASPHLEIVEVLSSIERVHSPHRDTAGDTAHLHPDGLDQLADIHRGSLALQARIRSNDQSLKTLIIL